jgi:hypothetical protein
MDGSLLYNKSIKDDKIDYVVMVTKELPDGQSFFLAPHNVWPILMYRCYVFIDAKFKKNRNHRFAKHDLELRIKKRLKTL